MARSETKKINEKTYTARCLSVAEVRDVLQQISTKGTGARQDLVEFLVEDGLPSEVFYLSLGLEGEQGLDDLEDPADIVTLMDMVAAVNPTFAEAEKRAIERVKAQVSMLNNLKTSVPT